MANVDKECVTHHYACDCREEVLQRYIRARENCKANPSSIKYLRECSIAWEELKKLKHKENENAILLST